MAPAVSNAACTAISADGTVIGYDPPGPVRRGRGLSTAEAGPYSLQREAEDVAAVAEAIGSSVGDVYVVGHSYGALATLEAALITPAFRRILLYEPPVPSPGLTDVLADGLAHINTMSDPREILDEFYRGTLQLPASAIKDLGDREFPHLAESIAHTAGRELAGFMGYRGIERFANITVPVQILLGTESPAHFRAAAADVASRIPGATIVALRGQGHQGIDYDPQQFVRAVLAFDAHRKREHAVLRRGWPDPLFC